MKTTEIYSKNKTPFSMNRICLFDSMCSQYRKEKGEKIQHLTLLVWTNSVTQGFELLRHN